MPVRRLQNYAYCPRLFYLQWVEGLFQENADTAEGERAHERVDTPSAWRDEAYPGMQVRWRSLELESTRLGLRGVVDLVEGGSEGLEVVDYKKGAPWRADDGRLVAKPFDCVQVQGYALLLHEQGLQPAHGSVYYAAAKRRVEVAVDEEALRACERLLEEARAVARSGVCPKPPEDGARCLRCAAYPLCLPGESRFWADGVAPEGLEKTAPRPEGDEGELLVVQDPRARVGLRGRELLVERRDEPPVRRPLEQIRAVVLYGAVQVSAQALHALLERAVPVSHFSPAGRFLGMTQGLPATGTDARRGQYRLFEQPATRLGVAREVVRAKLHNQRTMLMRNGAAPEEAVARLAELRDTTASAGDMDALRGMEGAGAALYFRHFGTMLGTHAGAWWDWSGRNRRPPRDPVNALLSLGYSALAKELAGICHTVGLDPFLGFFHQPRFGRPALALDLMEEFRPLVADSVAISLLNRGEIAPQDFVSTTRGVLLGDGARRAFWQAWARRLDTEVTHPEFGYRMSYRRMMDVQARQIWRFCRGECASYRGFTTR